MRLPCNGSRGQTDHGRQARAPHLATHEEADEEEEDDLDQNLQGEFIAVGRERTRVNLEGRHNGSSSIEIEEQHSP